MSAAFVEAFATTCNIMSNAILLRRTCWNARGSVPIVVVGLQIIANVSWISYAILSHDVFLLMTASTSMAMQMATAYLLQRASLAVRLLSRSDPQLPRM